MFTRIINGELPASFVYTDDLVVVFLSIAPLTVGHTLVVPREEVDQWTDAGEPLLHHCMDVARRIGNAAKQAFGAPRAGLVIAGLEVATCTSTCSRPGRLRTSASPAPSKPRPPNLTRPQPSSVRPSGLPDDRQCDH